jgi:hypothetical protein
MISSVEWLQQGMDKLLLYQRMSINNDLYNAVYLVM